MYLATLETSSMIARTRLPQASRMDCILRYTMDRAQTTNKTLIFISGLTAGILVSSCTFVPPLVSVFIIFLALAILIVEKVYKNEISAEVILISIILISVGLGSLRYAVKDFHEPLTPSSTGIVVSEPAWRENTTRFTMLSENGERVLVSTDLYSHVQYGDRVRVDGNLEKPGIIDDGVGRPFDYAKYLAKDDIYYTLSFAEVEILSSGHGNFLKHKLLNIKHMLLEKIGEILAEPGASLLAG